MSNIRNLFKLGSGIVTCSSFHDTSYFCYQANKVWIYGNIDKFF
jgi:hypothetical protein